MKAQLHYLRLVVIGFCIMSALSVQAAPILISGSAGVDTGSWQIDISASVSPNPDMMEAFIQDDGGAGPFEGPGLSDFVPSTWAGQLINPGYALASGPSTASLEFVMHFLGDINSSVSVDFLFYAVGDLVGVANLQFIGGSISGSGDVHDPTGVDYDRTPVPAPPTIALLGIGVAGIGYQRRRRMQLDRQAS